MKIKVSSWRFLLAWALLLIIIIAVQGCATCNDFCHAGRVEAADARDAATRFVYCNKLAGCK